MKKLFFIIIFILFSSLNTSGYSEQRGVELGDEVILDFKMTNEDTNEFIAEGIDFQTIVSYDQLIEGFVDGILRMHIGDVKDFVIPPEKGHTDPDHALYGISIHTEVYLKEVLSEFTTTTQVGIPDETFSSELNLNKYEWKLDIFELDENVSLSQGDTFGIYSDIPIGGRDMDQLSDNYEDGTLYFIKNGNKVDKDTELENIIASLTFGFSLFSTEGEHSTIKDIENICGDDRDITCSTNDDLLIVDVESSDYQDKMHLEIDKSSGIAIVAETSSNNYNIKFHFVEEPSSSNPSSGNAFGLPISVFPFFIGLIVIPILRKRN